MTLKSIWREPLLHFLVLAVGIFVLHDAVVPEDLEANARKIVVDRAALLNFIQYRSKAFDPEMAEQQLASLTDDDLQMIIDDLIREEALAREARALGLDQNDYIIKRRLVQKIDYIARGFAESAFEITDADIKAYFEENKSDFYLQPRITFTHVFFGAERHGADGAMERAAETLQRLRENNVHYAQAGRYGERFLYGLNFADRSKVLIESQFGTEMTEALFSGEVPVGEWSGPFETEYGAHIALLANLEPGREPTLEQVLPQVTQQASRALAQRRAKEASQQIVDRYAVELAYPQAAAVN
jgi:hypothetical protein